MLKRIFLQNSLNFLTDLRCFDGILRSSAMLNCSTRKYVDGSSRKPDHPDDSTNNSSAEEDNETHHRTNNDSRGANRYSLSAGKKTEEVSFKRPPSAEKLTRLAKSEFHHNKIFNSAVFALKSLHRSGKEDSDKRAASAKEIFVNRRHNFNLQPSAMVPFGKNNPYQTPESMVQYGMSFKYNATPAPTSKGQQQHIMYQMVASNIKKNYSTLVGGKRPFSTYLQSLSNGLFKAIIEPNILMQQNRCYSKMYSRNNERDIKKDGPKDQWKKCECCPDLLDCDKHEIVCVDVFDCPQTCYPSQNPPDCPPPDEPPPPPEHPLPRLRKCKIFQPVRECFRAHCDDEIPIINPRMLRCMPANRCPCIEPPPLKPVKMVRLPKVCLCPDPPEERCITTHRCPPRADMVCKYERRPKKLRNFWCPLQKMPHKKHKFCKVHTRGQRKMIRKRKC